jgi:hypothetical protein
MVDARNVLAELVRPERLWSRAEILQRPCPLPARPGLYGWYFKQLPHPIDTSRCATHGDLTLLYVGIAPKAPPGNGRPPSRQTLRSRIRYHYRGNAAGSTLRLTLGCLLAERLGIELRRVGSGNRLTFAAGERRLSDWMAGNAFVTWAETDQPWLLEGQLIGVLDVPLNLDQNRQHPFHQRLARLRAEARVRARVLPIAAS